MPVDPSLALRGCRSFQMFDCLQAKASFSGVRYRYSQAQLSPNDSTNIVISHDQLYGLSNTPGPFTAMRQESLAKEAQSGFAASTAYDAHRPSYPPEAISQLLSALKVADVEGATVADLAAGTGKFTELLALRPEKYNLIGIEPLDGMRSELERKKINGLRVVNGTAENMPGIKEESVDALIASQVS